MTKPKPNNLKRSKEAITFVLNDFSVRTLDIKGLVNHIVTFFEQVGLEPTRMGFSAKNVAGDKMKTYKREIKKLEGTQPEDIINLTVQATMLASDDSQNDDLFTVDLSDIQEKERASLVLTIDEALITLNQSTLINEWIKQVAAFVKPNYGYVFQRPYKLGPTWYPFGIIMGLRRDEEDEERSMIDKWGKWYSTNSSNKYKTGDMRDIYPVNILSQAHQRHIVDGLPLFEWIKADKARGHVDQLDTALWAWWVDPDSIPIVREALRPLGWVVAI